MRIPKIFAIFVAISLGLSGCAAVGLLFDEDVQVYKPEATWGESALWGFCPSFSPSIRVNLKNPDWLQLDIGIWDSTQTEMHKWKEPTLFIVLHQSWTFSIEKQKRRVETPISISASSPYLEIVLADGTKKQILVEEFSKGFSYQSGPVYVYLEVPPQDMTVHIPNLKINDELVQLGPVHFSYQHAIHHPC